MIVQGTNQVRVSAMGAVLRQAIFIVPGRAEEKLEGTVKRVDVRLFVAGLTVHAQQSAKFEEER
jgi:hypothetical protein